MKERYYDGLKEIIEVSDQDKANEMLRAGLLLLAIKDRAGTLGNTVVYVLGRFI
jgi:hypothetical protein